MVTLKYTSHIADEPNKSSYVELKKKLSSLNDTGLLQRLEAYRLLGRRGYSLKALWRAHACMYFLDLHSTNAIIRRLRNDPELRRVCGFTIMPHRMTFNRFENRLSHHPRLVTQAFAGVTNELKGLIPNLGQEVAVDSTVVKSHSRPYRKILSDPEASWTAKNSPRAKKGGKEWFWGYKVHMVADANHGIPLAQYVTTASRNDSPELPTIIAHAENLYSWFRPKVAIADRGYDALSNHEYLWWGKGIIPIIHIRRKGGVRPEGGTEFYDDTFTKEGIPVCIGQIPMTYIRSDPKRGHLYRCVGCHLAKSFRGGVRHCDTEIWQDPTENIRLFGVIRRDSPEWEALYAKRQAIERVFKSMKESRRLDKHYLRGLRKITLHALMSALTYQVTVLVKAREGRFDELGWQVEQVA